MAKKPQDDDTLPIDPKYAAENERIEREHARVQGMTDEEAAQDTLSRANEEAQESEQDDDPPPFASDLASLRQRQSARDADDEVERTERAKVAARKKGRRSWLAMGNPFKRDLLAVPDMKEGYTPKDPTGYYRWIPTTRVQERLQQGWALARADKVGKLEQDIPGTSTGAGGRIQRNEMVLMRWPRKWKVARDEYVAELTDAQETEMEEAAARHGLQNARPGHFGRGRLSVWNQRRRERMAAGAVPRDDD